MTDLAVIILTKDEKLHIRRCLERLSPLEPRQVFIVDSLSTDGTQEIVEEFQGVNISKCEGKRGEPSNLAIVEHPWPGLYAKQFNWALDNLPLTASWILRLDADEYLTPETVESLKAELPRLTDDVTGLTIELKRRFMGGEIRHGTSGIRLMRLFRHGVGRCEERAMDEHIVLSNGHSIDFDGAFYDDNLNSMDWWREKHHGYAKREAIDALAGEKFKRSKTWYYRCPRYLRAFAYFCYRYFFRLGFLDGYAGWMWHFWQGLWYRWLVDREIGRMKRARRREGRIGG